MEPDIPKASLEGVGQIVEGEEEEDDDEEFFPTAFGRMSDATEAMDSGKTAPNMVPAPDASPVALDIGDDNLAGNAVVERASTISTRTSESGDGPTAFFGALEDEDELIARDDYFLKTKLEKQKKGRGAAHAKHSAAFVVDRPKSSAARSPSMSSAEKRRRERNAEIRRGVWNAAVANVQTVRGTVVATTKDLARSRATVQEAATYLKRTNADMRTVTDRLSQLVGEFPAMETAIRSFSQTDDVFE